MFTLSNKKTNKRRIEYVSKTFKIYIIIPLIKASNFLCMEKKLLIRSISPALRTWGMSSVRKNGYCDESYDVIY